MFCFRVLYRVKTLLRTNCFSDFMLYAHLLSNNNSEKITLYKFREQPKNIPNIKPNIILSINKNEYSLQE